jgi:hypothetical protein
MRKIQIASRPARPPQVRPVRRDAEQQISRPRWQPEAVDGTRRRPNHMSIEQLPGVTTIGSAAQHIVNGLAQKRAAEKQATNCFQVIEWDGKPISQDGIYDMPIEVYHSNCCIAPSISSSGLRTIESESPKKYWWDSYLNPARRDRATSKAFDLGSAAHHLFLGEAKFGEKFCLRPDEWADWRTNASKAWRDEQIAAGKIVLEPKDIETLHCMAESLKADPIVATGVMSGQIESSLIWKDPETGVWLKARPDALPLDDETIADLKTTTSCDLRDIWNTVNDLGYHLQLALIGMGMEHLLGRKFTDNTYALVFVEKVPPYDVAVIELDIELIIAGRALIRRAVRRFADCLEKDDWPGRNNTGKVISAPDWYRKQIETQVQMGLLRIEDAA